MPQASPYSQRTFFGSRGNVCCELLACSSGWTCVCEMPDSTGLAFEIETEGQQPHVRNGLLALGYKSASWPSALSGSPKKSHLPFEWVYGRTDPNSFKSRWGKKPEILQTPPMCLAAQTQCLIPFPRSRSLLSRFPDEDAEAWEDS